MLGLAYFIAPRTQMT